MVNKNDDDAKSNRSLVAGVGIVLAILLGGVALAFALGYGITNSNGIGDLNRDVDQIDEVLGELITNDTLLNDTITTLLNQITVLNETIRIISTPPGIHGLLGFWWADSNTLKSSWARFNDTTGAMVGSIIPYSPSEARLSSGPPGKVQFSQGPNPTELIYLVWSAVSFQRYLVRHDTAASTFLRTDLGADPALHDNPEVVAYDPINGRYIAMAAIPTQSSKYAVVVIDENTGAITPLTGAGGTLPPTPVNVGLAVIVLGDKILVTDRYDDNPANLGHIMFYNSSDGQYLSESFFNGTFIPYAGTFLPSALTNPLTRMFYLGVGYDPATFRFHILFTTVSGASDRLFGHIQGTSEADLLSKLETGNYDIYMSQFMPSTTIQTITFLEGPQ